MNDGDDGWLDGSPRLPNPLLELAHLNAHPRRLGRLSFAILAYSCSTPWRRLPAAGTFVSGSLCGSGCG